MKTIKQLVRKEIREMKEINWGEISGDNPYRLLWGENQQPVSEYRGAIFKEIKKINLYPSANKLLLRQKIADYNKVQPENIVLTNGSDEALELIAKVFIREKDEVITPSPSYPCFESVSQMMGAKILKVPLKKNFSLGTNSLINKVTKKTKVIWIANPNNPTGNLLLTKKQIEYLVKKLKCLLVIDECYFELGGITATSLIKSYPSLIIVRSFSKVFALAGARLGYIIANQKVTTYLNRLQQTNQVFCVNRFAYAAGIAIMSKPALMQRFLKKFITFKLRFEKLLAEIPLKVLSTNTTFCLVKLPKDITGKELKEKLERLGIFIKDCSIYPGLGKQYIYLGIPQKKYQKKCIKAIKTVLEEISC